MKHNKRTDQNDDVEKIFNVMDSIETGLIKFASSLRVKIGEPDLHWIKQYLKLDYPDIKFETNKRFSDPDRIVNDESDEFKVPVYSENPLIICEVTSIVVDLEEVKRLVKIKNFFKKARNKTVDQTYLLANEIEEEIEREVKNYCKEYDVIFVNEKDF